MFHDQKEIKLQMKHRNTYKKYSNMQELNNILLNNPWIMDTITRKKIYIFHLISMNGN